MFLQVFQGRVEDAAKVREALDHWAQQLAPAASGWLGTTAGVTDDGLLVATARFTSEETAQRNSGRPEQDQWWTQTSRLFTGDVVFHDCREVVLLGPGGSDAAGFVQVMQGRSDRVERLLELARAFEADMSTYRPDLLGVTIGLHGDGGFTQIAYFTNEAEARAGESQQPPVEVRELLAEQSSLMTDVVYHDMREPWLYSP